MEIFELANLPRTRFSVVSPIGVNECRNDISLFLHRYAASHDYRLPGTFINNSTQYIASEDGHWDSDTSYCEKNLCNLRSADENGVARATDFLSRYHLLFRNQSIVSRFISTWIFLLALLLFVGILRIKLLSSKPMSYSDDFHGTSWKREQFLWLRCARFIKLFTKPGSLDNRLVVYAQGVNS